MCFFLLAKNLYSPTTYYVSYFIRDLYIFTKSEQAEIFALRRQSNSVSIRFSVKFLLLCFRSSKYLLSVCVFRSTFYCSTQIATNHSYKPNKIFLFSLVITFRFLLLFSKAVNRKREIVSFLYIYYNGCLFIKSFEIFAALQHFIEHQSEW